MSSMEQPEYHLHGFPICPMCLKPLDYKPMPGVDETYWYCKPCHYHWGTGELIECMAEEELWDYLSDYS